MIRELRDVPDDVALGTELAREYVEATALEIGQDLETILPFIPDVHDFAGRYFDGGAFLVADNDGEIRGCVGVTPLDDGLCEMNRLWVRAPFRRRGLARELVNESLAAAQRIGFARMILDVVPSRVGAIALYLGLGFTETEPQHDYPFDMVFLARDL